jgi:uncharacterized protein (DUF58 family)
MVANEPAQELNQKLAPVGAFASIDRLIGTRLLTQQLGIKRSLQAKSPQSGAFKSRFRGRGMEFEEVRVYQPGDDIRTIDWRVTARTQTPHTKLFVEEREKPIVLLVDQRSPMFFGTRACFKSVYACHIAAVLGWAALKQNDRIGALIFGDHKQKDLRPKRSKHTQLSILQELVAFNRALESPNSRSGYQSLADMLTEARHVVRPGSQLFVISDFHDINEECAKQLHLLGRHNHVGLLAIYDPMEYQLPSGHLAISDGNQQLFLDHLSKSAGKNYQAAFLQRQEHLKSVAASGRLDHHLVATNDDFVQFITTTFATSMRGKA